MSKFKRTSRSNMSNMEVILVGKSDQSLASGALVGATTALSIADGQLGVLSWDFDGTVSLGTFITAGVTASQVKAIKVLQGTPKSGAIHTVDVWGVSDPKAVESGIIYRDNIRSVASMVYKVGNYAAQAVTDIPTVAVSTEYGAYVYLNSVRGDRDYSDNDEVVYESQTTPTSLSGINDTTDWVLTKLAYKLNTRSKLANFSNSAAVQRGNKSYIVLAINTTGGTGQAIGAITSASTPTTFSVMNDYDADGNATTTSLTATDTLVASLAKVIKAQADSVANGNTITNQITTASTVEVIDLKASGQGIQATGTITTTGNFTANDEVTIGATTYTFVASPSSANDVDLGASAAISLANLAAAVNGSGVAGTTYGTGTVANASATAVATATTVVLTARTYGTAGNSVVLTEDTDGGTSWSVSGSGTLTGGLNSNVDAMIVIGLDESKAAYSDNIEQVRTDVSINPAKGLNVTTIVKTKVAPEEGTGQYDKWVIANDDRFQQTIHTSQNQPYGEFFSKGYTYLVKDTNYTSTIIDYYDYEETLTTRQVTPKKVTILLPAAATSTSVTTAVTQLASGQAIATATSDTTTVSSLEGILGAWLDSAVTFSGHALKAESSTGSNFA